MHINISEINLENFYVNHREIDGIGPVVLVIPRKDFFDWDLDSLHLRSVLCRPDGEVISAGFPKFFNFGEKESHDDHDLGSKNLN